MAAYDFCQLMRWLEESSAPLPAREHPPGEFTRAPNVEPCLERPQEIQQVLLLGIAQTVEDGNHAVCLRALAGVVFDRLQ